MIACEFPPNGRETRSTDSVQIHRMGRPSKPLRSYPNRIRALREARGLSLEELAAQIGVTDETLRRYEIGDRKLKVHVLERIAHVFEVPSPQLLTSVDPVLDEQERALLALYRAARPEDRERLLRAAPAILGAPAPRKAAS